MNDHKTSRNRLPKRDNDDNVGVTFGVFLGLVALAVAVILAETLGFADAFINSFA